jgi:predicted phosphodiesterase
MGAMSNRQRWAIISDIHGNLEAFQAVLADIADQNVSTIYCLGDIVGYGPNPRECLDLCFDFQVCLLGNHDNGALFDPGGFSSGAERAIFWTRRVLEDVSDPAAQRRWMFLAKLPRTHRDNGMLYVHGSPRNPLSEYVFPEDANNVNKMSRIFGFIDRVCFHGHTHVPGVFTQSGRFFSPRELNYELDLTEERVLINVGSVGQPRDNDPRSCYVIAEPDRITFRRVTYPWDVTREKILSIQDLDNFLGDRLLEGR